MRRFLVGVGLLVVVAIATAQDALPTRSFQRFGSTKLRHGSRILALAYSPEGTALAAGGGNDPVRVWNPKTGQLIQQINEPWVHALTFSASGETLLFGGYQKIIKLWNFRLNKETGRLEGHKATVKAIAISTDAGLIVSGSQDGAVILWDMNNKRHLADLKGHTDEVNALIYHVNGDTSFIVSASSDRSIIVWSIEEEQQKLKVTQKLKLDAGCAVQALALSPDGKTLYSAGDDHLIRRWDLDKRQQTGTFKGHEGIIVSLFLNGDTLVSGALDKTVRFWDVKSTAQTQVISRSQGDCDALAVTRAGDFLAIAGLNNNIRIFDAKDAKEVSPGVGGISSALVGMSLSKDNQHLAGVTQDGHILVWSAQAGTLHREWDSKQTGDLTLAFAPDSKTLAVAGNKVHLWDADKGIDLGTLPTRQGDPIVSLAWSPDGKTLALGHYSSQIELWNVKDKKTVGAFKYDGSLHAIAWSPDGKKLAAAGGARIVVWDPQTSAFIRAFDVKEGPPSPTPLVASLAFGPDSKTLAAGGWDAVIRIFNLNAKNPTEAREVRRCEGHLSAIFAISFSADGRTLVSGSFDRTARLWEAFSGKQIAELKGHIGEVRGVAFAKDGRRVYSASTDCTVLTWDVPGLTNDGKLPALTLAPQQITDAWVGLATEETGAGHKVMWECIASSQQAVSPLTSEKKICLLDPERVKKLFKDLDSGHYPTRIAAAKELSDPKYGRWMEGRYDAAIANASSLEYKRRVEALKDTLNATNALSLAQERLRVRRIMLMCEQVGTPEAIAALQRLADRGPEEDIRDEAKMSLERLKK